MITLFRYTGGVNDPVVAQYDNWTVFARMMLDDISIETEDDSRERMSDLYETCKARGMYWSESNE